MTLRLPHRFLRSAPVLVLASSLSIPLLADCGDIASCDAVCDNVIDKCADFETEIVRNNCLESCEQRKQVVPEKCAAERDAVLECLALATSVDCGDPQQSAACSSENAALGACAAGTDDDQTSGTGGGGAPCDGDDECATGLCNWKTKQCATPADIGAPCDRDEECSGGLCNWSTDQCAVPGELGAPCDRDEECTGGLCNWSTDQCSDPGGSGAPCGRDEECISGQCPNDTCS